MDIKDASIEELQAEIERKKQAEKENSKPGMIAPLLTWIPAELQPQVNNLRNLCHRYIDSIGTGEGDSDDLQHYIFEAAMEVFYGKDVWTWINKHSR